MCFVVQGRSPIIAKLSNMNYMIDLQVTGAQEGTPSKNGRTEQT